MDLRNFGIPNNRNNPTIVGLFWFTPDYSAIDEVAGVREFNSSDVKNKLDVFPEGFHNDYASNTSARPRSRVSIIHGTVVINVGLKCPDSAIELAVRVMGLEEYRDTDSLHVNRGYHWDAK